MRTILALGFLILTPAVWANTGDLNGDGRTDRQDLGMIESYLRGEALLSEEQLVLGDINRDNKLNNADIEALQRRLNLTVSAPKGSTASVDLQSTNGGRVVDQKTGKPLAGVEIEVPNEGIRVVTDQQGRFTLPSSVPSNRILTARVADYAPFSLTTQGGKNSFEVKLEQLNAQTIVLDNRVRHLGDNRFSSASANSNQMRLPSEGNKFQRVFKIEQIPDKDPFLKIGSLVGVDTPNSVMAGQSKLPVQNTFSGSVNSAFRVFLNGTLVKRLTLNGDNILIPLPRWLLKKGSNELILATASEGYIPVDRRNNFADLSGGNFVAVDFDDIEFANLTLVIPGRDERNFFRGN